MCSLLKPNSLQACLKAAALSTSIGGESHLRLDLVSMAKAFAPACQQLRWHVVLARLHVPSRSVFIRHCSLQLKRQSLGFAAEKPATACAMLPEA